MKIITRALLSGIVFSSLASNITWAQSSATTSSLSEYEYPELNVTPRASERLKMESINESKSTWTTHLPIQISALSTFAAGALQLSDYDHSKDDAQKSAYVGLAIGGGWLATTMLMSQFYTPYRKAYMDVARIPDKTKRDQLTRERLAEEAIEAEARIGNRLMWMSTLSNLFASTYMISKAESGSNAITASAVAALLSFTPMVFTYNWQRVAEEQRKYKKNIYAPVASASGALLRDPTTQKLVPGFLFALSF